MDLKSSKTFAKSRSRDDRAYWEPRALDVDSPPLVQQSTSNNATPVFTFPNFRGTSRRKSAMFEPVDPFTPAHQKHKSVDKSKRTVSFSFPVHDNIPNPPATCDASSSHLHFSTQEADLGDTNIDSLVDASQAESSRSGRDSPGSHVSQEEHRPSEVTLVDQGSRETSNLRINSQLKAAFNAKVQAALPKAPPTVHASTYTHRSEYEQYLDYSGHLSRTANTLVQLQELAQSETTDSDVLNATIIRNARHGLGVDHHHVYDAPEEEDLERGHSDAVDDALLISRPKQKRSDSEQSEETFAAIVHDRTIYERDVDSSQLGKGKIFVHTVGRSSIFPAKYQAH